MPSSHAEQESLSQESSMTAGTGEESRFSRIPVMGRVLLFWLGYLALIALGAQPKLMVPEQWQQMTWGLVSSLLLLPLVLLFVRWEKLTLHSIGMKFNAGSLWRGFAGTLIGMAIFGLIILLISLVAGTGAMQLQLNQGWQFGTLLGILATTFALSCMEEMGFRGYSLRMLVDNLGLWPAQIIVAIAFGLCHIAFGWNWNAVLMGVIPAALLFGMSATASRGLAMPIGLHAGVNLAQWTISEDKANPDGIWTLVVSEEALSHVATISPFINIGVILLTTLAFWYWHKTRLAEARD